MGQEPLWFRVYSGLEGIFSQLSKNYFFKQTLIQFFNIENKIP